MQYFGLKRNKQRLGGSGCQFVIYLVGCTLATGQERKRGGGEVGGGSAGDGAGKMITLEI